jgi:hypothetical protein
MASQIRSYCAAFAAALPALLASAALAGGGQVMTLNLSGIEHWSSQGSSLNHNAVINVPPGSTVIGVGWAGTLTAIAPSSFSDARIRITDQPLANPAVLLTPGSGNSGSGTQFFTSNGIIMFADVQLPPLEISSGSIRIEFFESNVHYPGGPDAYWTNGTLSLLVEMAEGGCDADLTGDYSVDVFDLLALLGAWGPCPGGCAADLNGDGAVDVFDLLALLGAWGPCPPPAVGACCMPSGACQSVPPTQCAATGGSYQGDGVSCEQADCPQPNAGATCITAIPVAIGGTATANTVGNAAGTAPVCIGLGPSSSGTAWFKVVGNGTGLFARTCGSSIASTRIAVYCGSCANFTCVTSSSNAQGFCPVSLHSTAAWCTQPGKTYYIAVWGGGTLEGGVSLNLISTGNPCSGAVQCVETGLCANACGLQSAAGCWCDNACVDNGDCCPDRCDDCPGLIGCDVCEPVTCSVNEGEPCGMSFNNGCNASPPQTFPISCGQTVCGNLWANNDQRDADWFTLTLSQTTTLTWSAQGPSPMAVWVRTPACPGATIASSTGCTVSTSACLPPGTYYLVITPLAATGYPCPGFTYSATVTCEPTAFCPDETSCAGNCGGQAPSGCWCDGACVVFGDCCADMCQQCPEIPQCSSCTGSCGGEAPGGCWCDESCVAYGDCCHDICSACPSCTICGGEGCYASCAGNCGNDAGGCWCTDDCIVFGDCCPDICQHCPAMPGCGGAASDEGQGPAPKGLSLEASGSKAP